MNLSERVAADMPRIKAELEDLVRIPGCAFPGFPDAEVERASAYVMQILTAAGYATVERIDIEGGKPAVLAETAGPPGSPTVLLYAHYDVQPAGDESLWLSPPFEPTVRDGRLYGRGAADDKSGVVMHAALMRAFEGRPPCTVRVIVEGEEEWGGPFADYPRANPHLFASDAIVVADVGNARINEPTFTTALRGMGAVTVECRTLQGSVHSGMFGGPAPDALMALIGLLATMRDGNGDTCIDGIEGFDWDGPEFAEADFRELAGVEPDQPLVGTGSIASRLFSKPVINVTGIDAPATEGAINAVIPFARARVSLRVPPDQDATAARAALIRHLQTRAPWGVKVSVIPEAVGQGVMVDTSGPAYAAARRAMERAYGKPVQEIGAGGSIPLIDSLRSAVPEAEILLFGAQDPMARIHAPNESVDLAELQRAVLAQALFIEEFGGVERA
ncbi:MAG: M20/M25/M40 family metallo-hydrolase [Candidatus Nanopelagicales bacterium]|nr:M20/M25/M40 family metallo-hydrolase [Candidatus Nanopelagicales bacterium]